jgi:hypothetical protein
VFQPERLSTKRKKAVQTPGFVEFLWAGEQGQQNRTAFVNLVALKAHVQLHLTTDSLATPTLASGNLPCVVVENQLASA